MSNHITGTPPKGNKPVPAALPPATKNPQPQGWTKPSK